MAMQQHALSNARLGEFIRSETETIKNGASPALFNTRFQYQYGSVTLDTNWKYHTRFNDDDCAIPTNGTYCPLKDQSEDTEYKDHMALRKKMPVQDFISMGMDYAQGTDTTAISNASMRLAQASIDGMDDMSESAVPRSAADETSLKDIEFSTTADIDNIKQDYL